MGLALILLWLAGFSLRVTVLALPPVLERVAAALGLDAGDIGVVTATPSLCFAVAAVPCAVLISRAGILRCVLIGLGVAVAGSAIRSFSLSPTTFVTATAVMSLGIALAQTALPSLTRAWLPGRIGLATATYTFGLLAGEIAPVALVIEGRLAPAATGWPSQLLGWTLPVMFAIVVIAALHPRRTAASPSSPRAATWPDWSEPVLWQAGVLLGAVNAIYFGLNGFLPGWLAAGGQSEAVRRTLLALNAAQLPAAFLMMRYTDRLVASAWTYVAASAFLLVSATVLGIAPTWMPATFAALSGFVLALLLSLALTVAPLVTDQQRVPALTAGIFTVGYGAAVVVNLAVGWLSALGSRWIEIAPVVVASLAVAASGPLIARCLSARSYEEEKRC